MTTADDLAELDLIIATATDLRARLSAALPPPVTAASRNLSAPADAEVDTWAASERLGIPIDTVRWLARDKGFGVKRGGRWMVRLDDLRRYLSERE